jgi:hypothetical protein
MTLEGSPLLGRHTVVFIFMQPSARFASSLCLLTSSERLFLYKVWSKQPMFSEFGPVDIRT